jgi:hypothetical protein
MTKDINDDHCECESFDSCEDKDYFFCENCEEEYFLPECFTQCPICGSDYQLRRI